MLLAGGSMIFLPKFDLETVLARLPMATTMMGVPTFYTRLLDDARFDRGLTGHMRLFISGPPPRSWRKPTDSSRREPATAILERYGMTETSMNTSNPYDGDRRAGTVGMALAGCRGPRLRIPKARPSCPRARRGMLHVRGPNVFQGLLADAREDPRGVAGGWLVHHRRSRQDRRGWAMSPTQSGAART